MSKYMYPCTIKDKENLVTTFKIFDIWSVVDSSRYVILSIFLIKYLLVVISILRMIESSY